MLELPNVKEGSINLGHSGSGNSVVAKNILHPLLLSIFIWFLFLLPTLRHDFRRQSKEAIKMLIFYLIFYFRIHLNDLENIIPFILVGNLYILTSPPVAMAIWHFRLFFTERLYHFVAYFTPLPQPNRVTSFYAGWLVNVSMGIQIIISTMWTKLKFGRACEWWGMYDFCATQPIKVLQILSYMSTV